MDSISMWNCLDTEFLADGLGERYAWLAFLSQSQAGVGSPVDKMESKMMGE